MNPASLITTPFQITSHVYPAKCYVYLLSLELLLSNSEGSLQQLVLLLDMAGLKTSRDRRTWVASSIHDVLPVMVIGLVQDGLDTWLGEGPGTSIERLLLAPDDGLGIWIAVQVLLDLLPWEWVELLDTGDGGIGDAVVCAVLLQCGVDLAGTQDHALDVLWLGDGDAVLDIRDDPAELGLVGELVNGGAREWVTEEGLGEEDDEC